MKSSDKQKINTDYDLIIIGGGMVGASLACALASQSLRVAIVEAVPYQADNQPSYDDRAIALSFGSRRIFDGLGLWPEITQHTTAINRIHVSDQGRFGFARLDNKQENVDALGYVITARDLGGALVQQLDQLKNLTLISPAKLTDLKLDDDHATAIIDNDGKTETLTASLIVAADGGNSAVRQILDIHTTDHDYKQTAIVANITPEFPHQHVAYERFTQHGPLALLPMEDNRCALVWTHDPQESKRILELNDEKFLDELQTCFGQRLGRFLKTGKRSAYPLKLVKAQEQVRNRLALIGNAAHTLHPIAGQGFNLGLRDVATLAQIITDASQQNLDIGALDVLEQYAQWRTRDHRQVIGFTNTLVSTFSNH
ncbi:MAG: 2-octaprenyl-6-methoxyphenyl hydroxylase, partial [Gammaproteobacteria bacterium]|nr:2-octaprenyl-6-methoxyphenyl hydroxylase [Gammaproteobacteria bacterium]